jgi:tRNA pseudouridine55 synthase
VVARVRRLAGEKRVGHAGTLDPLADGVLPVLVGRATRLADFLHAFSKSYLAVVKLGVATTTDDAEGEVLATAPIPSHNLESALCAFRGTIEQMPPQYSAVQVGGQRAYAVARKGGTLTLAPRSVTIHSLEATHLGPDMLQLSLTCGSGTYVRALARDLAQALGTVGHLTSLTRTRVGPFTLETAHTLDELAQRGVAACLLPADAVLPDAPAYHDSAPEAARLAQGQAVPVAGLRGDPIRVYDADGRLVCLAHADGAALQPRVML